MVTKILVAVIFYFLEPFVLVTKSLSFSLQSSACWRCEEEVSSHSFRGIFICEKSFSTLIVEILIAVVQIYHYQEEHCE